MEAFLKLWLICVFSYWKLSALVDASTTIHSNHVSVIDEMAVKMLKECYENDEPIVIHGESDQSTIKWIQDAEFSSAILHGDSSIINDIQLRLRPNLFLMTPHSETQLQKMLLTFKNSPWWDIMSSFFILDKSNRGCNNAPQILKAAWKMNLVKSFFLCVDYNGIPKVVTYNPYTNRAPQPWKQVTTTANKSNGWTMYTQPHRHENMCEGLDFDRTKHLDGAVIRAVVNLPEFHTWIPDKDYDESIIPKLYVFDKFMVQALKYSLNATFIFNVDEEGFDISKEPQGFYKRIQNGSSDVAICLRTPSVVFNFTVSYPAAYSKYHIVTNNRGFYTPWEKIKNYYGMVTLVSMCIILSMTFVVILLSGKGRRWAFAGFEILRLLVNAALHSGMNTLARKIFFAMIFLYFLIIHATFQGHLSAFLTKNEYRRNVEKLEDLRDSRYSRIYIGPSASRVITDPILKKKLIIGHPNCAPKILGDDSAACIGDILYLLPVSIDHKLHLSKNPIGNIVYIYTMRDDWPLKKRFNTFLKRLEHTGIVRKLYDDAINAELKRQNRIAMSKAQVRPVSLSMLKFAFIIYAIGMSLATICFILERQIHNLPSRRAVTRLLQRMFAKLRR